MSRPREFNVIFDNKLGIFRNGQKMTGAVLIETDEPLDFEGILVTLSGSSFVKWEETVEVKPNPTIPVNNVYPTGQNNPYPHGPTPTSYPQYPSYPPGQIPPSYPPYPPGQSPASYPPMNHQTTNGIDPHAMPRKETRHYERAQTHLDIKTYLYGSGSSSINLPPGRHTFPFNLTLPQNIPSSFQGQYGYVMYSMEVTIKRGIFKFDYDVKVPFFVNCILDLNREPNVNVKVVKSDTKNLDCLCWKSGNISAQVSIPKKGYISGELIYISAEIVNNSKKIIESTSVKLIQVCTFKAQENLSKTASKVVCEWEEGSIQPGETFHWNNVQLRIPNMPPSRLDNCSIIDIDYQVLFAVDPDGFFASDLVLGLPILIGNVAINANTSEKPQLMFQVTSRFNAEALFGTQTELSYEPVTMPKQSHSKRNMSGEKVQNADESYLNWRRTN